MWLAYDEQLDSPVAVKVLADNWTEDHHVRQRFLEEGRFLRKVESPHVVSVYDAGELDDGRPYLVMSYADQGTLADRLEVEGLTVGQAIEVVRQVGLGLQALHDHGVLHRDVKPANVLFRTPDPATGTARGDVRAMLGDLGLGKAMDMSSRLTMIAGTPTFVAPEQAQGEHLDARADQYSLGRADLPAVHRAGAVRPRRRWPRRPRPASRRRCPRPGVSFPTRSRRSWPARSRRDRERAVARRHGVRRGAARRRSASPHARPCRTPGCRSTPSSPSPARGRRALPAEGDLAGPDAAAAADGAAAVALAVAAVVVARRGASPAGYVAERASATTPPSTDDTGSLSVTVPDEWERPSRPTAGDPPTERARSPRCRSARRATGSRTTPGEGVFVGIMPADRAARPRCPQHPECDQAEEPMSDEADGDPSVTVFYTGCPGGVHRRAGGPGRPRTGCSGCRCAAADRATANTVLDGVDHARPLVGEAGARW